MDSQDQPDSPLPATPLTSQATNPYFQSVIEEPPVVVFPSKFEDPLARLWSGAYGMLSEPAYGAKRVFDLFTLMAITLAFGLLFGAMKALDSIPEVFFGVTTFVTFVGIGQMLLFGGNSPRLASLVGGPIALVLTMVLLALWYGQGAVWAMICSLILGVPAGYLAGGMVAGVFLIADSLRDRFSRPVVENEKSFWDSDDPDDD